MFTLLILSLILVIGSAIVSICEASIFSVNKIKVQTLAEEGNVQAKKLFQLKENMSGTIGTLVLLANIFGIVGALFVGGLLEPLKKSYELFSLNGFFIHNYEWIYTFVVILFGEVIPKNAGEKFALRIALVSASLILLLASLFRPLLWLLNAISKLFVGETNSAQTASEAEVIAMTDLGLESHSIEKDEHEIIQNVFKMNDKTALDIMTPRVQIDALDSDLTLEEQKEIIYSAKHSRLPVYGEDYDDIKGFVLLRDVLEEMAKDNLKLFPNDDCLLHKAVAVKETTKVDQLLISFQKNRVHLAIVIDDYGGTSGLVTLEDVLEELVGEIIDETDTVVDLRMEKNEHQKDLQIVG
jgi:CBS domain containing-hemolysin-like protein